MDRVSDERLAFLLRNEGNIPEFKRDDFYRAALDLRDCRAERDALKATLENKLRELDGLIAEHKFLNERTDDRDRLRALLVRLRSMDVMAWNDEAEKLFADIERALAK